MPLRRVVSQSETISALSQCRTLRRGLEAVYGPYSTSAPLCTTQHETRRQEHERGRRLNSPSRPCRQGHEGCDLNSVNETEITPHEAEFRGEGNRLLPSRGRGEGVRPRDTARGRGTPMHEADLPAGNQRYGVVNEPCSGPVGPCCSALLSINKYRLVLPRGQPPPPVVTRS